ncbi:MAG: SpoIID/LytB domain-containing protein [Chlamydiales bacterium]|nr:SpoIID/LytB domain-containing protein [Chlamydiales bacterium]
MNRYLITCLFWLTALSPTLARSAGTSYPSDFSQKEKPATIKVELAHAEDRLLLEVKGRYAIYDPLTGIQISRNHFSRRAQILPCKEGLQWKELFPNIYQIRIVPDDLETSILVNGIQYKGCVEIYNTFGKLQVINEIDLERYLKSTLAMQISQEYDDEVLEAIAIAARTNAFYLTYLKGGALYHIEACDAGYQGNGLALQDPSIEKAIHTTRNVILTYQGLPFAATWTENSAGKTASYSSIFRKESLSPPGAVSAYAAHEKDKHSWSFTVPQQELAQIASVDTLTGIDLYVDPSSEKVYAVRLKGKLRSQNIDFFRLQKALGKQRLRSNAFSVTLNSNQALFKGFGEGHGVGLCLFGASSLVEHGSTTQEILATFFPNTQIENIRDRLTPQDKK